ncbi:hypothetical protein DL237_10590 [Pseudooceanicola sediminis]|uniref:Uncharacterized protein n=1 Tax=Pseudooceanicola sediminis TaxID=2211117 RepID=A0A399J235_9RHOB|nr:hypothetical protein [Pseudooceanicola sediminis]KAA2313880.1 hypothetical protein E0K93_12280 [Puniceibacterium sp. HSS470]RII38697.1 hypothetical protein DL237_10590 [Pseudooceanicola sediminis]|tara:strand:+ start:71302 stop:72027 length:726 start_codon:yes stop_codon:yes gene_type:complete
MSTPDIPPAPRIIARCHPALAALLPEPQTARAALPDWLRTMPAQTPADTLNGDPVRTLKHCPPFLDALSLGLMMPLATDLHFDRGAVSWDWDPPVLPDTALSRAPIALHLPEQAKGAPYPLAVNSILKFINFWTLETPPGTSLLFTHPLNREDLPFRTLSGVVDCDLFRDGYVHFPALWLDRDFTGTLPAGTPIAQVIALPRGTSPDLEVTVMTDTQIAANRRLQDDLATTPGTYRKRFRH